MLYRSESEARLAWIYEAIGRASLSPKLGSAAAVAADPLLLLSQALFMGFVDSDGMP